MSEDITDIKNHTAYDIVLSAVYLPILIQTANNKKTITYGELVQTGKELHPDMLNCTQIWPVIFVYLHRILTHE